MCIKQSARLIKCNDFQIDGEGRKRNGQGSRQFEMGAFFGERNAGRKRKKITSSHVLRRLI